MYSIMLMPVMTCKVRVWMFLSTTPSNLNVKVIFTTAKNADSAFNAKVSICNTLVALSIHCECLKRVASSIAICGSRSTSKKTSKAPFVAPTAGVYAPVISSTFWLTLVFCGATYVSAGFGERHVGRYTVFRLLGTSQSKGSLLRVCLARNPPTSKFFLPSTPSRVCCGLPTCPLKTSGSKPCSTHNQTSSTLFKSSHFRMRAPWAGLC
mmetsp:Transcript_68015/g.221404  ORF Transcript_68015/g.221404 Transcript_68015/m.221404 type:complete len:209 (+) Transcript_68015:1832-2458(+)